MTLGARIRELRTAHGLSQRRLGDLAGVDYTYLSKIENDRVDAPPSVDVLRSLAGALRADEVELFALTTHLPTELTMIARDPDAMRFFRRAAQVRPSSDDWREMFEHMEERATARRDSTDVHTGRDSDARSDAYRDSSYNEKEHGRDGRVDGYV